MWYYGILFILGEAFSTEQTYDISYIWGLKNDTNKLIYKNRNRPTDSKQTYSYQREKGRHKLGV